jgi:hypothetical protein
MRSHRSHSSARSARSIYHPVGTCRVRRDERAVDDPLLQARVDGLRELDASVVSRIVGDTHAPTLTLSEPARTVSSVRDSPMHMATGRRVRALPVYVRPITPRKRPWRVNDGSGRRPLPSLDVTTPLKQLDRRH